MPNRYNMPQTPGSFPADPHEQSGQDERRLWQSAYAGTDFLGRKAFLVLLALRDDPKRMIYATLEMGSLGVQIDIPLEERTSEEALHQKVNLNPTLWGDIDPEGRREATETFTRESLVAALNRKITGADTPRHVPGKFYETLRLAHGERYGSVFVSSHGSDRSFNATIEPMSREFHADLRYTPEDVQIGQALDFAQLVEASLPHLTLSPLPVDAYLQDVRATLGFLPQD